MKLKNNLTRKLGAFIALIALAAGFSSTASAITWNYQSSFSPQYLGTNDSYSGVFDLTTVGYNPATHTLTSAIASFAFADDSDYDSGEYVNITLGNPFAAFITGQEVDGDHPAINFAWYGAGVTGTFLADLTADGKLNWKVKVTEGDTYLKIAKLTAEGTTKTNTPGVPDGGSTIALLGVGLMGLAALRRRLS